MSVSENAARGQARLVFRRKGKLIEAVGRRLARREKVECEYWRTARDQARRCDNLVAGERADDDVITVLGGPTNCFSYAGIASVVDGDGFSLAFGRLVIRGHKAIADGGRRRRLPAGDRQQQCYPRSAIRSTGQDRWLLDLLIQQFAADDVAGRMIWVARTPGINVSDGCVRAASRCCCDGSQLQPATSRGIGCSAWVDADV